MGDPIMPEDSEKKKDANEKSGTEKKVKKKKGRILTGIGTISR
ncbi:MAG: hypothetical protein WBA22_12150 [Candidatus Methanofastidiosia archaeon]